MNFLAHTTNVQTLLMLRNLCKLFSEGKYMLFGRDNVFITCKLKYFDDDGIRSYNHFHQNSYAVQMVKRFRSPIA